MPPEQPKSTASSEDHQNLITRIDTLQKLLNGANSQQALDQAYESTMLLQTPKHSIDFNCGIDLETDNLVTHFSKLWLRKEPDPSFFQATHPALVKLRQQEIPRWQQSKLWKSWTEFQAKRKYQHLSNFDPFLLPTANECRELFQCFMRSYDWYFELLTETESNLAQAEIYWYRTLGLTPTSPEQWTRVALTLAVCRLTLASSDWVSRDDSEQKDRSRYKKILDWCDLSVMALQRAGMDQNPTVEDMRVVIILTSTIFFETDYGLMGSAPEMFKLYEVALDMSERLNLHRDPPPHLPSKEKDDRRRVWWALVTIDAHFCSTGVTSRGVLRLQNSDARFPAPRETCNVRADAARNLEYSYLRSSRSRFDLGKINNKCCHLLSQRRPLPTLAEIWELDRELVALEENVPIEHRLSSDLDLATLLQRPLRPAAPMDDALRNGQLIFYIAFWHIRSKIHRGLLYLKHTCAFRIKARINIDLHRHIVQRCSFSLVHLYRHTNLPTAFTSAIVSAALTLLLELLLQPSQTFNHEIRTIALECFSRLQNISSPIINRACKVLEYFLRDLQPHVGIPISYSTRLNGFQTIVREEALENTESSYGHVVHELHNTFSKPADILITDSPLEVSLGGNSRNSLNVVPSSSKYESGAESSNRTVEIAKKKPTVRTMYQIPGGSSNDLAMRAEKGAIFKSQGNTQNPSLNESIYFESGDYFGPLEEKAQPFDASGFHIGPSDLLTLSAIHSRECQTHLEAKPPLTIPCGIEEMNLGHLDTNWADQHNEFSAFTSKQPMIGFANLVPPVPPNVASAFDKPSINCRYQDTLQQPEMGGSVKFIHNHYSNDLQGELGSRDSSYLPIEASTCPSLQIQPGVFLSHYDGMHRSTATDPNAWCNNIKENIIPRIESAHSFHKLGNSSADEVNYHQGEIN